MGAGAVKCKRAIDDDASVLVIDSDSDIVCLSESPSSKQAPRRPPRKKSRTSGAQINETSSCSTSSRWREPTTKAQTESGASATNRSKPSPSVVEINIQGHTLRSTAVFDTFWRYAASRQQLENRRRTGEQAPWTDDPILQKYRFCSVFRVSDAHSQFLIREVIEQGSQGHDDVVFRVILFNIFTRIETYQKLEMRLGPLTWKGYDREKLENVIRDMEANNETLYTGAFQKPAPTLGKSSNWENHLQLLDVMMKKAPNIVDVIKNCKFLVDIYDWINCLPGMGDFTAHQLLLDLSYAGLGGKGLSRFHPSDFVIAGKGAVAGINRCFNGSMTGLEIDIMRWMCDNQEKMFKRLGLTFEGLQVKGKSRPMQLCDIEHTLCEVFKYQRLVDLGAGKRNVAAGGKARKFDVKHDLEPEATIPKAWENKSRLVSRIKPGKFEKVAKEYVVRAVMAKRPAKEKKGSRGHTSKGIQYEYLVDWLGYGASDRTWEPAETLKEDAPEMIDEYEREQARRGKTKK